jgi:hypothetical protein
MHAPLENQLISVRCARRLVLALLVSCLVHGLGGLRLAGDSEIDDAGAAGAAGEQAKGGSRVDVMLTSLFRNLASSGGVTENAGHVARYGVARYWRDSKATAIA